jgi:hypothetical protein
MPSEYPTAFVLYQVLPFCELLSELSLGIWMVKSTLYVRESGTRKATFGFDSGSADPPG